MICIKASDTDQIINGINPKELNEIDDELKAIYHSKDTVCTNIISSKQEI